MIKFTFKENGITTTKEFEKYHQMLRFVATNRIKDEDFISLQFDEESPAIVGIDGLAETAVAVADGMEAFEKAMEAMESEEPADRSEIEFDEDPWDKYENLSDGTDINIWDEVTLQDNNGEVGTFKAVAIVDDCYKFAPLDDMAVLITKGDAQANDEEFDGFLYIDSENMPCQVFYNQTQDTVGLGDYSDYPNFIEVINYSIASHLR